MLILKEKDKTLFLISLLKVFIILFLTSFVLRLVGFDKFGFIIDNNRLIELNNYFNQSNLNILFNSLLLSISTFLLLKIMCDNKKTKIYIIVSVISSFINMAFQISDILFLQLPYFEPFYFIFSFIVLIICVIIIDRKIMFKRFIFIFLINMLYQAMASFIRNVTFNEAYSIFYDFLLNFDYIILLVISYLIKERKGKLECKVSEVVGSFLLQRISFKNTAQESQKKLSNANKKKKKSDNLDEEELIKELTDWIYLILCIIWNVFTLFCVIFISTLNTTLITTFFILTSFLITKSTFGEAFHMKKASTCFIVSNLTYFILSRITSSVNVSFWIPIILGVGLSYGTSLLVKKKEVKKVEIVRGMDEDELKAICKRYNLNSFEIKLLIDFYVNKLSLVKLSIKYNYSKEAIFKKKKKALDKINKETT